VSVIEIVTESAVASGLFATAMENYVKAKPGLCSDTIRCRQSGMGSRGQFTRNIEQWHLPKLPASFCGYPQVLSKDFVHS